MRPIDSDYIFTMDGDQVLVAYGEDAKVRVVLADRPTRESVYFNLSAADAHELGTKLRLAAKKARAGVDVAPAPQALENYVETGNPANPLRSV